MKTLDTKRKSATEALANSFGSYPIGYGVGLLVLPISIGWLQEDLFTANLIITSTYAAVSFARVYFFRRIFERFGLDDNFFLLCKKLYQKLKLDNKPQGYYFKSPLYLHE